MSALFASYSTLLLVSILFLLQIYTGAEFSSQGIRHWVIYTAYDKADVHSNAFCSPKSATVPVYSAECSPAQIRGALVMMCKLAYIPYPQ